MSFLKGLFYVACFVALVLFYIDWYVGNPTHYAAMIWPVLAGMFHFISDQQELELKEAHARYLKLWETRNVKL